MSRRTLFISDIHGRVDALQSLLAKAEYRPTTDKLLLLGDYVGNSIDNLRCLMFVLELIRQGDVDAIMGNHDAGLADFLARSRSEATPSQSLRSYVPALAAEISQQHPNVREFVTKLPYWHEEDDYIAVHAGVNPNLTDWRRSSAKDFTTIRDPFLKASLNLGKPVIFGHTPCFTLHGSADVWYSHSTGKIGIDGGANHDLQLNCLIHEAGHFEHVFVPVQKEMKA